MENSSDPGGGCSVDGVRVLEEGKGSVGGTQVQDADRLIDVKEECDGKIEDKGSDVSVKLNAFDNAERVWGAFKRARVEGRMSGEDAGGSLGVMKLVGRVLDGNFGMEEGEQDFKHLGDETRKNLLLDFEVSRDVIGKAVSGNGAGYKRIGVDEMLDEQNFDLRGEEAVLDGEPVCGSEISNKGTQVDKISDERNLDLHLEGTDLNGKQNMLMNEQVPDVNSKSAELLYDDKPGLLIPETRGEDKLVINEPEPVVNSKSAGGDNEMAGLPIPKTRGERADLNGKNNVVVSEHMSYVNFRDAEGYNGQAGLLVPKTREEECITEKEGEYFVSDLVWGKVRSHPWWPGQVFEPSAASEEAIKYSKRDSYLLAYFGDQTFAWNEVSKLKPFRMNFSQMEKQSYSTAFCLAVDCALEETARRVELGLSCSCLQEEVHDNIRTQVVANAGILEEASRRDGRDSLSGAASFLASELLTYLKELAEAPKCTTDRLKFVIAKAQLLAFSRWKGHYQLPGFQVFDGLLEDDSQVTVLGEGGGSPEVMEGGLSKAAKQSKKRKSIGQDGSSRKRKHLSDDDEWPDERESLSSSRLLNGEKKSGKKASKKMGPLVEKRKHVDSIAGNSNVERRKRLLPPNDKASTQSQPNSYPRVGERICRAIKSFDGSSTQSVSKSGGECAIGVLSGLTLVSGESQNEKLVPVEDLPPHEIFSMLCMAAEDPIKNSGVLIPNVNFFCEFRNSTCMENDEAQEEEKHAGKHKEKLPSNLETAETFGIGVEGVEDSYWTDRIIQSDPEEKMIFEPENATQKVVSIAETEAAVGVSADLDNKQESNSAIMNLEMDNLSHVTVENAQKYSPTALILNFTDLQSIPSIPELNEIFSRYGPLNESETEVLSKSKRVKVIFKSRVDAEAAFSSTGKFSIFGPSLVSYKLNYCPTPRKAPRTSKRNRK